MVRDVRVCFYAAPDSRLPEGGHRSERSSCPCPRFFFWPTPYPGNLQGWLWFREDILHLFHPPRAARMAAQRAFRWDLLPGESVHDWVDRFEDVFVMPPLPFPMDHGFLCFVFARALPPWVTFMVEYPDPPNILLFMDTVRVMVPDIQPVLALPAQPAAQSRSLSQRSLIPRRLSSPDVPSEMLWFMFMFYMLLVVSVANR